MDDNVVIFTPHCDDTVLMCPECGQSHWYIYASGVVVCSDCDEELGGWTLLETPEDVG